MFIYQGLYGRGEGERGRGRGEGGRERGEVEGEGEKGRGRGRNFKHSAVSQYTVWYSFVEGLTVGWNLQLYNLMEALEWGTSGAYHPHGQTPAPLEHSPKTGLKRRHQ